MKVDQTPARPDSILTIKETVVSNVKATIVTSTPLL